MSNEQSQQLLDTIDAVLAECSKDPRRRSTKARPLPTRPAWRPTWVHDDEATDWHDRQDEARTSGT